MSELKKLFKKNKYKIFAAICLLAFTINSNLAFGITGYPGMTGISSSSTSNTIEDSSDDALQKNDISSTQPQITDSNTQDEITNTTQSEPSTDSTLPLSIPVSDSEITNSTSLSNDTPSEINNATPVEQPFNIVPYALPDLTPKLKVTKTFSGVDALPANFEINIGPYKFKLDDSDLISTVTNSDGSKTITWEREGITEGTYSVTESNADIDFYNRSSIVRVAGIDYPVSPAPTVEVKVGNFDVNVSGEITAQDYSTFPVGIVDGNNFVFGSSMTDNYIIIFSATELSPREKEAILDAILSSDLNNGSWKRFVPDDVVWYPFSENNNVYGSGNYKITYDPIKKEITFDQTSQWTKVISMNYDIQAAQDGDVNLENSYTRKPVNLVINKTVSGNLGDKNQEFTLNYTLNGEEMTPIIIKHNVPVTLTDIPVGAELVFTEDYGNYTVSYGFDGANLEISEDGTTTITIPSDEFKESYTLNINNYYNVTLPTGIYDNSEIYTLLLSFSIISLVFLLNKKLVDCKINLNN